MNGVVFYVLQFMSREGSNSVSIIIMGFLTFQVRVLGSLNFYVQACL